MNVLRHKPQGGPGTRGRPRVLLVGPDPSARREAGRALEESGRFELAGEAALGQAVRMTARTQPDVVLLELPRGAAPGVILRSLLEAAPAAKIVILAPGEGDERGLEALRAGAAGFLGNDFNRAALVRTLTGVVAGEAAISRDFAAWLIARAREEPERPLGMRPVKSRLTAREWEVLDLLSAGTSKPAIARDLSVTLGTVRSHLRSLTRKLSIDAPEPVGPGGARSRRASTSD